MKHYYFIFIFLIFIFSGCVEIKDQKMYTVGISSWGSSPDYDENIARFKDALAAQGFIEGKNILYIIRNANSDVEEQLEIAEYFNDKNVDLIYSLTTPGTIIIKSANEKIPIVFSIVTYPVEAGIIASLENSGNNLVGTRNYVPVNIQYNEFYKILPKMRKMAFVYHINEPNSKFQLEEFKLFFESKGIEVIGIESIDKEDIAENILKVINDIDAVYASCDTLIQIGGGEVISNIAMKFRKPVFSCIKEPVNNGALFGIISDQYIIGYSAGIKAAKILKGTSPSDIVTESSDEYYIIINKKTAQNIGINIPKSLYLTADEVI